MASPPDPEDLKTIGGLAAAAGGAILWLVYYVRKGMGQSVCDPQAKSMLKDMGKDIERIEGAIRHAIDHAEKAHDGFRTELGEVKLAVARVERDVEHLQDRRE